jgi:hypothetical protein
MKGQPKQSGMQQGRAQQCRAGNAAQERVKFWGLHQADMVAGFALVGLAGKVFPGFGVSSQCRCAWQSESLQFDASGHNDPFSGDLP